MHNYYYTYITILHGHILLFKHLLVPLLTFFLNFGTAFAEPIYSLARFDFHELFFVLFHMYSIFNLLKRCFDVMARKKFKIVTFAQRNKANTISDPQKLNLIVRRNFSGNAFYRMIESLFYYKMTKLI